MQQETEIWFGRFSDLQRCYGIPRSSAYILINEGKIKSRLVKTKDSRTGIRLIDMQSVRYFLNGSPEKPSKKISNEMRRARSMVGKKKAEEATASK